MASEKNIAYTNIRCQYVSNYIRSNLGQTDKYEVGETLIGLYVRSIRRLGTQSLMLIVGLESLVYHAM